MTFSVMQLNPIFKREMENKAFLKIKNTLLDKPLKDLSKKS